MMILILETSSEKGLLILAQKDQLLCFKHIAGGKDLSKYLALEIKQLMGSYRPKLIALGVGPGSYTGIRVGAALAKGLAFGFKADLMGFCSLKSFGLTPILIDARAAGFYALLKEKVELINPKEIRLKEFSKIYSPHPNLIQKRIESQECIEEAFPSPKILAKLVWNQFIEQGPRPLRLNYMSHP